MSELIDSIKLDRLFQYTIILPLIFGVFSFLVPTLFFLLLNVLLLGYYYIRPMVEDNDEVIIENKRLFVFIVQLISIEMIFASLKYYTLAVEVLIFIAFYGILSISLNLGTGLVGVLNFGVVAQILVGGITYGILTVNYNMNIIAAIIWAMIASAIFSALLAITTLRLRDDYFAIISITMGEILRQILKTEPTTRGPEIVDGVPPATPGIIGVADSMIQFYRDNIEPSYSQIGIRGFFAIVSILLLILVYFTSESIIHSPYGRVLRSIREDDLVTSSYGKDILMFKVQVMAISGAIAGLGGVIYSWIVTSLFPNNFLPTLTFFVWIVFIIGGRGSNKGMLAGAIAYTILLRMSLFFNNPDSLFMSSLNSILQFVKPSAPFPQLAYIQLSIVGLVLILFIRFAPNGLIPERAYRPKISGVRLPPAGSQSESQKFHVKEEKSDE